MKKMHDKKGFSLAELMIVIAIIIILSGATAIGVVSWLKGAQNTQKQVLDNNGDNFENNARLAVETYAGKAPRLVRERETANPGDPKSPEWWEENDKKWENRIDQYIKDGCPEDQITVIRDKDGHIVGIDVDWNLSPTTEATTGNGEEETTTVKQQEGTTTVKQQEDPTTTAKKQEDPTTTAKQQSGGTTASLSGSACSLDENGVHWEGYQDSKTIAGDGRKIKKMVITFPQGTSLYGVKNASNSGQYNVQISGNTITLTFCAQGWGSPKTSLEVNNILWNGSSNADISYTIEYAS